MRALRHAHGSGGDNDGDGDGNVDAAARRKQRLGGVRWRIEIMDDYVACSVVVVVVVVETASLEPLESGSIVQAAAAFAETALYVCAR